MKWFKRKKITNVRFEIIDSRCWYAILENGRLSMYDPNGNQLFAEISCEIKDDCFYDIPRAKFEALVNVVSSKEQMQDEINKGEKKIAHPRPPAEDTYLNIR